ncbi:hypothetical protein ACLB2K_077128 [Fragaria x ananassa]
MATYCALLSLKSSLDDPDSRLSALRLLNVFNRTFLSELSNLTNLRVLDLYNNNLTGVLPVSVATFHYLYLPDMDGFEVQKRVRQEFKLPLIIVSADDREHVILKALKLGAAHYIVKPVCFDDVKNLWQFVVNVDDRSPKKHSFVEEIESGGEQSSEAISDQDTNGDHVKKNSKRRRLTKEGNAPKKAKLIWTKKKICRLKSLQTAFSR